MASYINDKNKTDILRDRKIDIVKGMAIIMMVVSHAMQPSIATHFIGLFHMAAFFIASGYCYKDYNHTSIGSCLKYLKRKILSLWLPFFFWNAIFVILHNFFISIHVLTTNNEICSYLPANFCSITNLYSIREIILNILKGACFSLESDLLGGFWFLKALFCVSMVFCIVNFLFRNKNRFIVHLSISLIALATGKYLQYINYYTYGIDSVLVYYSAFSFGNLLNKLNIHDKLFESKKGVLILTLSVFVLLVFYNLEISSYAGLIVKYIICSVSGWGLVYSLSVAIDKFNGIAIRLAYIGESTLIILTLHLVCFKVGAVLVCISNNLPLDCVAAIPNLYGYRICWGLLYSFLGISIPLFVRWLLKKVRIKYVI